MWKRKKNRKRTLADDHSSYVKHVLIPLFDFRGYHQTVSEEEGDEQFVGREAIISKLKAWLADKRSTNGAYLITGLRGMGKSSFVGKTLYELTKGKRMKQWAKAVRCTHWVLILLTCVAFARGMGLCSWMSAYLCAAFVCAVALGVWGAKEIFRLSKVHHLIIKINIGNETMGNQEILHLITKDTYDKLKDYFYNYRGQFLLSYIPLFIKLGITFCLLHILADAFMLSGIRPWPWAVLYLCSLIDLYPFTSHAVFFLLTYGLVSAGGKRLLFWCGHLEALPFQTGYGLLRRLARLHERSIATVSEDPGSINHSIAFSLFRRKEYRAPSVHETEQELISIFSDLAKLPFGNIKPVIVLDELDKIHPSSEESEKEMVPEFNPSVGRAGGKNSPRSRQREVLRMLAGMKYFMSTARAKFIFIAGRDLYEAYLKDVSDREFSVSSIFNGVINVQSFLKPRASKDDVISMAEQFVCERLVPRKIKEKTLKGFCRYKQREIEKETDKKVREVEIRRLYRNVGLLYQFIVYLAHISNGSPKKISIYFEKYIRTREYLQDVKHFQLEEPKRKCRYYLSFGTKDIQKIGFVHYVISPVTQVMINKSKVYEDRLLVSTSFMINHIYKYHNTGFSWRNLEHIPELLEINKTPELRDFIGTIISFLRNTHLTRVLSGLYLFKFPMKISEEISFMSKKSEDVSALFNFSQDESLSIRNHYINLLNYYTRDINRIEGKELHAMASIHHILGDLYQEDEDYSQAIFEYQTGLQLLSRQLQGNDYDSDPHWVSYMLFLVRNLLKLGLTYEKRKTLDSAYLAYNELVQHMVNYRFLEEKDFGLHYRIEDNPNKQDKDAILFFNTGHNADEAKIMFPGFGEAEQKQGFAFQCDHLKTEFARLLTPLKNSVITRMTFFDDIRMAYLPILAKLSVLEKMNMEGITQHNLDVAEAEFFFLHLATDDSEKVMAAAEFYNKFGDILYYKNGLVNQRPGNLFFSLYFWGYDLGGLKDAICAPYLKGGKAGKDSREYHQHRKKVESWFNERATYRQKNIRDIQGLQKYMQEEIGRRMGDECCRGFNADEIFNERFEERISLEKVAACVEHREKFSQKGLRAPCYACKYYNQALNMELERMMGWEWNSRKRKLSKAVIVAKLLLEELPKIKNMRETQHSIIGDTLKGLGCTFMGCADEAERISDDFLKDFLWLLKAFYENRPVFMRDMTTPTKLEKAMLLFWEASIFYGLTGDNRSAYGLNKHLVEILDTYLKVHPNQTGIVTKYLKEIKELIVDRGIMSLYAHYDHIHLAEIQRMKSIFGQDTYEYIDLSSLPVSPDVEELLYIYSMLQMRCLSGKWKDRLYGGDLMGPYKRICTLTQDIQNLKLKVFMNEQTFEELFPGLGWTFAACSYMDVTKFYRCWADFLDRKERITVEGLYEDSDSGQDRVMLLEFLLTDTLFCLAKIVDVITPLNNTTLYTNSFIGEAYEHLWKWTVVLELVYLCYKVADGSDEEAFGVLKRKYKVTDRLDKADFNRAVGRIRSITQGKRKVEGGIKNISGVLKSEVLGRVGVDTLRHLTRTDQMEHAIRYYRRSLEMHTEGKAYKEMIRSLFFLDDDLNNDTCQLAFGIERFLLNAKWISQRLDTLRKMADSASAYNLEEYLNH